MTSKKSTKKSSKSGKAVDVEKYYEKVELLGLGSVGKMYKVRNKKNKNIYAAKVIHCGESDVTSVSKGIDGLKTMNHGHITKYYDSFLDKTNKLWIIMEFCNGGSIHDIITVLNHRFTEVEIASVIRVSLEGLSYLHHNKKIHRDLRGETMLLRKDGHLKLSDFGFLGEFSDSVKGSRTVLSSPYWMAPEIIKEESYNELSDVWALGITILEMGEGRPPLSTVHPLKAVFMIPNQKAPTFTKPKKWSGEIKDFVKCCLQKDPNKRQSPERLLKHKFLAKAKDSRTFLKGFVARVVTRFKQAGGRERFYTMREEKSVKEKAKDKVYDFYHRRMVGVNGLEAEVKVQKEMEDGGFEISTESDYSSDEGDPEGDEMKKLKKMTQSELRKYLRAIQREKAAEIQKQEKYYELRKKALRIVLKEKGVSS